MDTIVALLFACAVLQTTLIAARDECQDDADVLLQTKARVIPEMDVALPKCILHVGPHKTGTTSLQGMLAKHAVMLQDDGWHQPPAKLYDGCPVKNLWAVALSLEEGTKHPPVWQDFVSWVQARANNKENIVLSSEMFDKESLDIPRLAKVLAPFRTTVVIGDRPFPKWLMSVYRQMSGCGLNVSLSSWLTTDLAKNIGVGGADGVTDGPAWNRYGNAWNKCSPTSGWSGRLFADGLARFFARFFKNIRFLELGEGFVKTFACSFLSANQTCAHLSNKPEEKLNVRLEESRQTRADACASQGGCLDQEVRNVLLNRTISSATEVSLLSHAPLNAKTEVAQELDELGLCFC